jgi:starch synthase
VRVLHVASEIAPFAQSGGLADVLAGLPAAQATGHGLATAVLVPLYRGVAERVAAAGVVLDPGAPLTVELGPHRLAAALRVAQVGGVRLGLVDCAALYDRDGLYGPPGGDFADNHLRFAALGKAALPAADLLLGGPPDVLHLHDWQAGAAAIYARLAHTPARIVTTIHNLAFRGIFAKTVLPELGIPWSMFTSDLVEFYDQLSLLKAGLALADATTTVSPSYAREILTAERGEGLHGFLRWKVKRLVGIVNGIDAVAYDPATDPALAQPYTATALAGKARCRAALADELGLPLADDEALIGVVARMTEHKGIDLIAEIVPELARLGARLVVLGAGDGDLERRLGWLADVFGHHLAVRIGFDRALARRIYAGSDVFAMPSRFEPCGLGQLYAMRYGAIPVVHAVGGLRDTVLDPGDDELAAGRGTGVRFADATAHALAHALGRAVRLVRDPPALAAVRRAAMARDSSWTASAADYVRLYRSLVG